MKNLFEIFWDSSGSFEGKDEGEEVLMLLRRHPFTILIKLALLGIGLLLPILVGIPAYAYIASMGAINLYIFLSSIWALALWLLMFHALTMYTLNVLIVTNKRIIDNDQYGLFNRRIAELPLARVQDISVHTNGLIETFLRFGNMIVQSAGSERQFTFPQIPHPERVKDGIMKIVHEHHMKQS
ncbi:MAG: PH domain-containing protein [bacterium]|nr:PH domain-containing protein [bacterium]